MASKLIGKPNTPRLNLEGSIGCPDSLLQTKHPTQTLYDTMRTPFVKDTKLLNATVLPMLINERRQEIAVDVSTALRGTSSFVLTFLRLSVLTCNI